jgi:hemerythrin superfamily protein
MKTKAPKRIWIDPATDLPKLSGLIDKDSVEYIRKDTFMEKARKWFEDQNEWFDINGIKHCDMEDFEDFKKYMKGE